MERSIRIRSIPTVAVVALAAALALPVGLANHVGNDDSGQYAYDAVEHDDQGRSNEPDGAATGVLGLPLANAVVDRDLDGYADVPTPLPLAGKEMQLAPGCTNPNGDRVMSGQCGIWTVGLGSGATGNVVPRETLDIPGFTVKAGSCPGRYGGEPVVLLDSRVELGIGLPTVPNTWYNVNHKLADADATTGGLLTALGVRDGLYGPTAHWAWYGRWQDLNCNGVIDHLQADPEDAAQPEPDNEFVWYGSCVDFDDEFQPDSIQGGYCAEDPNPNGNPPGQVGGNAVTSMVYYVWPGFHFPGFIPDLPSPWDWLEGDGGSFADFLGDDRTGELAPVGRLWMAGQGFPVWYYDMSLFFTSHVVAGVNCHLNPDIDSFFDLGATGGPGSPCTFIDVDTYETYTPLLEPLLWGLRNTVFNTWTTVTDLIPTLEDQGPISRLANQILGYDFYQNTLGPQQGMANDILLHPGWSREPNVGPTTLPNGQVVEDVLVDVRHRDCDQNADIDDRDEAHFGWCNYSTSGAPSAYAAYQGADFRGFLDVRPVQVALATFPVRLFDGGQCLQCFTLYQVVPVDQVPLPNANDPADPSDHTMTLLPGQWVFSGVMGRWRDATTSVDESVYPESVAEVPCDEDPSQAVCNTYPMDGWVGFLAGGQQDYEGYPSEPCVTEQPPNRPGGTHPWAECHPYTDGSVDDPQMYGPPDATEWQGACQLSSNDKVTLWPRDGTWSIPVIVWRSWEDGVSLLGTPPDLDIHLPGDTRPAELRSQQCTIGSVFRTIDHLFLPVGSAREDMVSVFGPVDAGVTIGGLPALDFLTDVDVYGAAVV